MDAFYDALLFRKCWMHKGAYVVFFWEGRPELISEEKIKCFHQLFSNSHLSFVFFIFAAPTPINPKGKKAISISLLTCNSCRWCRILCSLLWPCILLMWPFVTLYSMWLFVTLYSSMWPFATLYSSMWPFVTLYSRLTFCDLVFQVTFCDLVFYIAICDLLPTYF